MYMLFILIFVMAMPSIIFASGFAIYEHGATANGLAGAFGGIANDELLSPLLPDSDRMGKSAGISKRWSDNLTINVSYIHLFFNERTITNSALVAPFNGTYNGSAELIGFGVKYNF